MAQSVERVLGKDEVTSSNLVSSSRNHSKRFAYCGFLFCGDLALSPQVRRGLGRSPMLFPPGPPKTQRVFGVDWVTGSNLVSSSRNPAVVLAAGFSVSRWASPSPVGQGTHRLLLSTENSQAPGHLEVFRYSIARSCLGLFWRQGQPRLFPPGAASLLRPESGGPPFRAGAAR